MMSISLAARMLCLCLCLLLCLQCVVGFRPFASAAARLLSSRSSASARSVRLSPLRAVLSAHPAFEELPSLREQPVLEVSGDAQFAQLVEQGKGASVVDFFADWCGPCKMVAPVYLELAQDLMPQVLFAKVNADQHEYLAQKYRIEALPTFAVFFDGELLDTQMGFMQKPQLRKFIEDTLREKKGVTLQAEEEEAPVAAAE